MTRTIQSRWGLQALAVGALACLTTFALPRPAYAQTRTPTPSTGLSTGSSVLTATPDVHFDQKVNTAVPVDLQFVDETGKSVMLRDYITGKQPVILMLPFYKCAGACTFEQQGLMTALNSVKYVPGKDFQVVMVSINPKETPVIALAKKTEYTSVLTRKESAGRHPLSDRDARRHPQIGRYHRFPVRGEPPDRAVRTRHGLCRADAERQNVPLLLRQRFQPA